MTKTFKRILAACLAVIACLCAVFFSACAEDGKDGEDGKDLDIYDVYNAVNEARTAEGLETLTFLEFIEEYFDYVSDQAVVSADSTAIMNYSLLSGVAIYTQYPSTTTYGYFNNSETTYDVYVGSGVIIDVDKTAGDAYIITNAHVVYDSGYTSNSGICEEIYLYLYGSDTLGTDFTVTSAGVTNYSGIDKQYVQVVGVSLSYDLAVLKVTGSDVLKHSDAVAAKFCDDSSIYVGEDVYAVGNPSNEGLSVSQGIISRDSETIEVDVDENGTYESFRVFRMTAAINGGNSGGAVYNSSGEIIGIANATSLTSDNLVQGMCYALPANNARRIAQSMIDTYESNGVACYYLSKATIGINTSVVSGSSSAEYDATLGRTVITEEVTVAAVQEGTLAQGVLKAGDTLISYAIGKMSGETPAAAQTERYSGFTIPENSNYITDSRYCDTTAITRSYMLTEAMISVRDGDTVEVVIERDGNVYYMYFTFSGTTNFTQYS
ncbi:MAG: S1C family serine protease [Clostridia bacterium]|nr:S1C family serine protease [Clostridia bacterium]